MISEQLIDDLYEDEVHDVACDFVEQEIGRYDFANNWEYLKNHEENLLGRIAAWLEGTGTPVQAQEVYDELESLAKNGVSWT